MKRLDTAPKLNGSLVYAIDVKLPGMLNAAVKDCPVFGGKLVSFDNAKIAAMPGVKRAVKVNDTTVAVVADTWWHAKTALDALPIVWDEGANATRTSAQIAEHLKEGLTAARRVRDAQRRRRAEGHRGGADQGRSRLQHAVPRARDDGADELHGAHHRRTRPRRGCRRRTAKRRSRRSPRPSGLPLDKCEVYKHMLGGGFGRRGAAGLRAAGGRHRASSFPACRSR